MGEISVHLEACGEGESKSTEINETAKQTEAVYFMVKVCPIPRAKEGMLAWHGYPGFIVSFNIKEYRF